MTFILIPTDGPAHVVREHVTPGRLSDAVGGAIPVGLAVSRAGVSFYLRETCATDGSIRNPLAATYAFLLSRKVAPMAGPVALTGVDTTPDRDGRPVRTPICLTEVEAGAALGALENIWYALEGLDADVTSPRLGLDGRDAWAATVRRVGALALSAPFPPGFPYPETPAELADPVAALFGRLGITVTPQCTTGRI